MKLLRFLLRQSRSLMILSLVAGAVNGVASTAVIALAHKALNGEGLGGLSLGWVFTALCVLIPVTQIGAEVSLVALAQKAVYDLRLKLSERIIAAPLRQMEDIGSARLFSNLTDDVVSIAGACTFLPAICMQSIVMVSALAYLHWLSWQASAMVGVFLVLGTVCYRFFERRALRYLGEARENQDSLFYHFRALVDGVKELKLHDRRRRAFFDRELEPAADASRRNHVLGTLCYAVSSSNTTFLFFALLGVVVFGLPVWTEISRETLTGVALLLLFLVVPLNVVLETFPSLGAAVVALRKVRRTGFELDAEPESQAPPVDLDPRWRELELAGVTYSYRTEEEERGFELGPFDLSFRAGEVVFITGGNGSGKTTLGKLLAGLYSPESGELRIDGLPITDENREGFRQLFSAVFWNFHLFDRLLGLSGEGLEERVDHYLRLLRLDHKVEMADRVLSTTRLSAGQRKRLALLTAYLEDRPIYLFDEWAADQDPVFKQVFYTELLPELRSRGKTVFVISHDDRFYGVADRVVSLTDGRVTEDVRDPDELPRLASVSVDPAEPIELGAPSSIGAQGEPS